jgi:hypothetical protein
MLEHTACAQSRPEQAMHAIRRAVAGVTVIDGERGESEETAAALILRLGA